MNENPSDEASAATLLRSMSLLERTRARIARSKGNPAAEQPERDEARHFLQTELSGGDRPAKDLISLAHSVGIAPATLKRAKASLGVTSVQRTLANNTRCWMWSLDPAPTPEHPQGITGSTKMQIA